MRKTKQISVVKDHKLISKRTLESTSLLFLSAVCKDFSCKEPTSLGSVNSTIFFLSRIRQLFTILCCF